MVKRIARTQFAISLIALSVGSFQPIGSAVAQEVQQVDCECRAVSDCECGKWTCPCCQARTLCEPTMESAPSSQWPSASPQASPTSPTLDGSQGIESSVAPSTELSPSDVGTAPSINLDNGAFGEVPGASSVPGAEASDADLRNMLAMNSASGAALGGSNRSSRLGGETPEFMGDFFGPESINYFVDNSGFIEQRSPLVTPGARLGRQKLIENNSPIPQDRVFMNYSRFSNVGFTEEGIDVDRFTPGFEKTFLQGLASVELRTPFGSTINDTIPDGGTVDTNNTQFGNLFVGVKAILLGRDNWVVTGGMSVVAPTADDSRLVDGAGETVVLIDNGSIHLMPFVGGAIRHNSRRFSQWMVQVDVDATGNDVFVRGGNFQPLQNIGNVQQQNLLYVDFNTGYWLFRAPTCQKRGVTGIAWLNELHINRSLTSGDQAGFISAGVGTFDNINVLTGFTTEISRTSRFGVGYALPLGNGADNPFSNELRLTFNRYF